VCLDKVLFKELMSAAGTVPQVDYAGVHLDRWRRDPERVLADLGRLGLPAFVKPARLGSSLGIVKVTAAELLPAALEGAFAHDPRAIVEAMARGVEVECGVLACTASERQCGGEPSLASQPGEISFAREFYDFEAKYQPAGMELRVPARISMAASARVRELALEVFARAGCDGLARVDFFVDGEQVVVNELNTMPGFTPTSVYPKLMVASGIPYPELVDRLCRLALECHEQLRASTW
jgi:D-alanine-D-alanine ligase